MVLIRSGGLIKSTSSEELYIPFSGLSLKQRIVVHSSGSFGQHFTSAVEKFGVFEIVGWIDEDADESQRQGLPVTNLESISEFHFDSVVIASIDQEYSESIACKLENLGVERNKISRVTPDFKKLERILVDIGFDPESFSYTP